MNNKLMTDLQRVLKSKDFQSEKELNDFLKQHNGQIPSFPEEVLSHSEKAEDLIYEATETTKAKGLKLANQALAFDSDCIMAYEYLASVEKHENIAKIFLEKGIEVGKKQFGGAFEKENIGHFWMIHETRSYMTCMMKLGMLYLEQEKIKETVAIFEKLIYLNPNDNQGIRFLLSTLLLESKEYKKFKKLATLFKDDGSIFLMFNIALYEFTLNGASAKANKLLKEAHDSNPHVIPMIKANPRKIEVHDYYSPGSKEEVMFYIEYSINLWHMTPDTNSWISSFKLI